MKLRVCPRCKRPSMDPVLVRNALSRKDNKTFICNSCGTMEALEEMAKYQQEVDARKYK